jgi:hypothetical protein
MLSLVVGYESSLHLVYGRHIIFLTDHEPLVTLKNLKNPLGRIGRLLNRLQGVDYGILGMEINIGMVKTRNGISTPLLNI